MTIKKVIIQGRGSIGVRHANNLIKLGYYPVFLREKNEKKNIPHDLENIKEIFSFTEAIEMKPIGAVIATPTIFHPKHAIRFLKNKIPTYIEKPLGFNISKYNLDLLMNYSEKVLIHGGFNFLYTKEIQDIKKKVNLLKDKISTVEIKCHTNANNWHTWENPKKSYTFRKDLGGGVVHTCSHEVNFLLNLFPEAKLIKSNNKFENEVCTISYSKFHDNKVKIEMNLDFINDIYERYIKINFKDKNTFKFSFDENNEKKIKDESCYNSIKNFIKCIENKDEKLISTFEDAVKTYMLCEKIIHEK